MRLQFSKGMLDVYKMNQRPTGAKTALRKSSIPLKSNYSQQRQSIENDDDEGFYTKSLDPIDLRGRPRKSPSQGGISVRTKFHSQVDSRL